MAYWFTLSDQDTGPSTLDSPVHWFATATGEGGEILFTPTVDGGRPRPDKALIGIIEVVDDADGINGINGINNVDLALGSHEKAVHDKADDRRPQPPEKCLPADSRGNQYRREGACHRHQQADHEILGGDEVIPDLNILTLRALGAGFGNIAHGRRCYASSPPRTICCSPWARRRPEAGRRVTPSSSASAPRPHRKKGELRPQGMKHTESAEVLSIMPRSSTTSAIRPGTRIQPIVSRPNKGAPRIPRSREMTWVYHAPGRGRRRSRR